jgi:multidrug resistance efflux pump
VQQQVDKLQTEIAKTKQENIELAILAAQLKDPLAAMKDSMQKNNAASATGMLGLARTFIAPIDGYLNRIYKSEYETALRTEDVLSIQRRDRIFIKAFFEQSDIDNFKEGDVVHVNFPDGTKSKGIIKRLYLGTYDLPVEFQKKYEPTHRTVAADVYPLDSAETNQWKFFHKMNAEITKFKFW